MATMTTSFPVTHNEEERLAWELWVLGDALRLRVLRALSTTAAMTVSDMVRSLNTPQATLSRHLKHLEDAELIHREKRGAAYHVNGEAVRRLLADASSYIGP